MLLRRTLTLAALAAAVFGGSLRASEPAVWVDPFIGTTNFGTTNPGAVLPNGMMAVVPFNVMGSDGNRYDKDARWWSTPYEYHNRFFTGFAHGALSGVGCPDMGSLLTMATTGELVADYREYGSEYRDETASPGYYAVTLSKYGIRAEATATARTSVERYTFPGGKGHILLNLGEGLTNESGAVVRRVSATEIEGMKLLGTFCYNPQKVFPVYFVLRVSKAPSATGYWKKQRPMTGVEAEWTPDNGRYKIYTEYGRELAGDDVGYWFTFDDLQAGEQVEVRMGISYVSMENARRNLDAEQAAGSTFDAIRAEARARWNADLGRIRIEGGTDDQRKVFYTALYHALIHPNLLNDVNGEYPLMERSGEVGVTEGERYTVFSLWDTCRNVHQLLTLVYPERQVEMVRSMIDISREWGWMPRWELYGRETFTMEGDPAIPVIVDTWMKGLRDFDVEAAYAAFRRSATTPGAQNALRPDIGPYIERGYIPLGFYAQDLAGDVSVSHALEYYVADAALARLADSLGNKKDAQMFRQRSLGYRHYYCPKYGTLRPINEDGTFLTPFDPRAGENFLRAARCRGARKVDGRSQTLRREVADGLRRGVVRPGERTRHRLCVSVQPLPRRGVAHAAGNSAAARQILHRQARRHSGQRRHGHDVGLGCIHDAGLLSRLPGRAGLHADGPDLRPCGDRHGAGGAGNRAAGPGLHPPHDPRGKTSDTIPHQPRHPAALRQTLL